MYKAKNKQINKYEYKSRNRQCILLLLLILTMNDNVLLPVVLFGKTKLIFVGQQTDFLYIKRINVLVEHVLLTLDHFYAYLSVLLSILFFLPLPSSFPDISPISSLLFLSKTFYNSPKSYTCMTLKLMFSLHWSFLSFHW